MTSDEGATKYQKKFQKALEVNEGVSLMVVGYICILEMWMRENGKGYSESGIACWL